MKSKILLVPIMVLILIGCAKDKPAAQPETEGIPWITNIDTGLRKAADLDKIVMVDFMATWCPPCRRMEDSTFSDTQVIEKIKSFIPVRIDVDQQGAVADQYNGNAGKYGGVGIPNILFLDADTIRLKHIIGYQSPEQLLAVMDSILTATNGD